MFKVKLSILILISSALTILFMSAYLAVAYIVDPLYLFNSPEEVKINGRLSTDISIPLMKKNMRFQAFSIINNYRFDSVILGSSMLENTSSKTCNLKLGGTFINISMSGSSFYERKVILDYLLKKMSIKSILYSMDSFYLTCAKIGHESYDIDSWDFLYIKEKSSMLKKFSLYMTKDSMHCILGYNPTVMLSPDCPKAWGTDEGEMRLFGGIDKWIQESSAARKFLEENLSKFVNIVPMHTDELPVSDVEHFKKAIDYIEKNIFIYVRNNKQTKFYFVFPPYWRFIYAEWRQTAPSVFALHQDVIRYVVLQAHRLGNVEIYGFEDCGFVDDVKNYKDTAHHHQRINEYITQSIGTGLHRLTPDNVENYLHRCEKLALRFDFKAFFDEAKAHLESFYKQNSSIH